MVNENETELMDKVVGINRVSKVVKGGRRFSFGTLVVVGDGVGRVGAALGKTTRCPMQFVKGNERARKDMFDMPVISGTIPHEVVGHHGAVEFYSAPASEGTGVIAGGADERFLRLLAFTAC